MSQHTKPNWSGALASDGNIVIVGAGLAGLYTAIKLAPHPVTVVAAAPLGEGASSVWAQGGMAAAVGEGDTPEAHATDTIASGAGLVDEDLARSVAHDAPDCILDLLSLGVPFDKDLAGKLKVSREAAHSAGRVVRVSGDRAGGAIMAAVIATVRKTPSIKLLEGYHAHAIDTASGHVSGLHLTNHKGESFKLSARAIVLATGGIGGLYAISTNPPYARGEAIAMAARAGALIGDAEFVQFHPTALDIDKNPAPLATEALRGEGATLINDKGERFLLARDPRGEMASRDIVAQGVAEERAAGRQVFLDCREAIGTKFAKHFPTVYQHCKDAGLDPTVDLIPVAPAQHYHMGGIATDHHGRTNVPGLWTIGEAAATGLHGANRLASNSLLEAVVFGARAAHDIKQTVQVHPSDNEPQLHRANDLPAVKAPQNAANLNRLRKTMSDAVGVSRSGTDLAQAIIDISEIEHQATQEADTILANMALAARFIATAAYLREESRGAHFRRDFPDLKVNNAQRILLSMQELDDVLKRIAITNSSAKTVSQRA